MKLQGRWDIPLAERLRLQTQVDPNTGCHLMTKKGNGCGYVQVRVAGKLVAAHRLAFALAGKALTEGMEIDHTCSSPTCINPDHLEAVTHSENMKRAFARGTGPRGSRVLTAETAQKIRDLYRGGEWTQEALGHQFGISRSSINGIVNGRRWAKKNSDS